MIVDISNPSSPIIKGSYDTPYLLMVLDIFKCFSFRHYAYVADYENALVIIDISNPSSPTLKGSYDTNGRARDVSISDNYVYVTDNHGLVIIDISNPSSPILNGSYNSVGSVYGVSVSGNYAYVTDFDQGLMIVNISNLSSPILKEATIPAGMPEVFRFQVITPM